MGVDKRPGEGDTADLPIVGHRDIKPEQGHQHQTAEYAQSDTDPDIPDTTNFMTAGKAGDGIETYGKADECRAGP